MFVVHMWSKYRWHTLVTVSGLTVRAFVVVPLLRPVVGCRRCEHAALPIIAEVLGLGPYAVQVAVVLDVPTGLSTCVSLGRRQCSVCSRQRPAPAQRRRQQASQLGLAQSLALEVGILVEVCPRAVRHLEAVVCRPVEGVGPPRLPRHSLRRRRTGLQHRGRF